MNIRLLFILLACFTYSILSAQDERKYIRKGNDYFASNEFNKAEIEYQKALDVKANTIEGVYNLGNSVYKQNRYPEAIEQYKIAAETAESPNIKAHAYHNLGNAFLESQDYQKSVDAYIQSLKLNPYDSDTKYNLAYARQKLREQQNQQNQSENQDQQENQDQKQNQDQQENKNKENQTEQQEQENKDQQENKNNQQNKAGQMSPEQAERLLQQLNNKEQQVQDKLQKQQFKAQKITIEKDW